MSRFLLLKMRCRKNSRSYNVPVFKQLIKFFALAFLAGALCHNAEAASERIIKVLPQLLDLKGRDSLSPSLYERDAYQVILRNRPEQCSGLCFKIQWTGPRAKALVLRVEIRGGKEGATQTEMLEMTVEKKGYFSNWSSLVLRDEAFKKFGSLVAWRATLWDGKEQVAEQKSFLW